MDRIVFGKKINVASWDREFESQVNSRDVTDRFVGGREAVSHTRARLVRRDIDRFLTPDKTHDIWNTKYIFRKKYITYLDRAFGLEELLRRDRSTKTLLYSVDSNLDHLGYNPQHWPCVPRRKSYLSSADSVLDLPSYRYAPFSELLDWGGGGDELLVAALGHEYYKWSWRTQSLLGGGAALALVNVCKFDPSGRLLSLGTVLGAVELHEVVACKRVARHRCACTHISSELCAVTALHWSPTGNAFATGCSRGTICAWSAEAQLMSSARGGGHAAAVRVSPDARLLASSPLHARYVQLWTWTELQPYRILDTSGIVKTLSWHPWRSALLSVGCAGAGSTARSSLALWEANAGKLRHHAVLGVRPHVLDAALYSFRTGELVISLWYPGMPSESREEQLPEEAAGSRLLVLGDAGTVVDQLDGAKWSLDRVRTMMFSPDGTKLATATTEEDLIIWNFLPEDKHKRKRICKQKNFAAMPVYLDQAECGYSLR